MKKSTAITLIILAFLLGVFIKLDIPQTVRNQVVAPKLIHLIPLDKKAKGAIQRHSWGKWWI